MFTVFMEFEKKKSSATELLGMKEEEAQAGSVKFFITDTE
jgi:hypothetical protein